MEQQKGIFDNEMHSRSTGMFKPIFLVVVGLVTAERERLGFAAF